MQTYLAETHDFSRLFDEKILNFQWKVKIIHNAYCFQLGEFLNNSSLGMKINFEFASENSHCAINNLEHLTKILLLFALLRHSHAFLDDNLLRWFFFDVTSQCKLYNKLVSVYTTGLYKTRRYYFKGSFYCLLHVKSIAALTSFFGGFLAHICRPPLTDTGHVCITQTPHELVFV